MASSESIITRFRHFRSRNTGIVGLVITATVLFTVAYSCWPRTSTETFKLSISAGSDQGLRNTIAVSLAELAGQLGVELEIHPTSGSQESLQKVEAGEIDLALSQGGLPTSQFKNVQQIAVLHIEPLHLLVKSDLYESPARIHELRGRTVNISEPGSGTHALALQLLDFIGIVPGRGCQINEFSYDQLLADEMTTAMLPDAVFTVSSLPSPVARELIERHGFRPVELPLANAFRLDWLPDKARRAQAAVVRRRVVEASIPAFAYSVDPAVPETNIKTLGTRLQLVAHRDTSSQAVERLVEVVYATQFATISDPPLSVELLVSSAAFPLHRGARSYLEKKTPIITERVVELTEQVLAILGAVFGGGLFVWQALGFVRRKRGNRQFLSLIERVVAVEQQALRFEDDEAMTVDDLVKLQKELSDIKAEMIKQFAGGDIESADALSGFLRHVNDASELLTRVILHERAPRAT